MFRQNKFHYHAQHSALKNFFDSLWLYRRTEELERLAAWAGRKRLWSVRTAYLQRLHKIRKRLSGLEHTARFVTACAWGIHKLLQIGTFR